MFLFFICDRCGELLIPLGAENDPKYKRLFASGINTKLGICGDCESHLRRHGHSYVDPSAFRHRDPQWDYYDFESSDEEPSDGEDFALEESRQADCFDSVGTE